MFSFYRPPLRFSNSNYNVAFYSVNTIVRNFAENCVNWLRACVLSLFMRGGKAMENKQARTTATDRLVIRSSKVKLLYTQRSSENVWERVARP